MRTIVIIEDPSYSYGEPQEVLIVHGSKDDLIKAITENSDRVRVAPRLLQAVGDHDNWSEGRHGLAVKGFSFGWTMIITDLECAVFPVD